MEAMMDRILSMALAVTISTLLCSTVAAEGNAPGGKRVFAACAACHSLEPGRNMTGPSLAELWDRKAGSLASFQRYSSAIKASGVIWGDHTLDQWLKDPQQFMPGNEMTFAGIKNYQQRTDLLAFLKLATLRGQQSTQGGAMGGMMGGSVPNLKKLNPEDRVQGISYCGDTYRMTTGDGKTRAFWERNLRLKTDGSNDGPERGAPALVGAGMMGDRADVIFAAPDEISALIKHQC
jgi:cytochrome c